ncbi:MAG: carbohydrate binding domain-containing protein, partial [Oscillospiraceae bacterium]|nr:carbohydrate binding domain-containing protein [Oscillospiraceae bacterium]
MKRQTLRRMAAGLAACTFLAAALPFTQLPASAANLITNATFESGSSDWGMYKESGGAATLGTDGGRLALHVTSTGKVTYSVQMFYDIIPLYQNGKYRLKYDISCTTNRFVEGMIQQNGGTYQAYTWKGIDISPTPTTVDYEFTMKEETDIMAKLVFNCGLQEKDGGSLGEHTIYLDNVSLELVDDSQVDYGATRPYEAPILTNQIGYRTDSRKIAVVRNASASTFSVVDAQTNQSVYTG